MVEVCNREGKEWKKGREGKMVEMVEERNPGIGPHVKGH